METTVNVNIELCFRSSNIKDSPEVLKNKMLNFLNGHTFTIDKIITDNAANVSGVTTNFSFKSETIKPTSARGYNGPLFKMSAEFTLTVPHIISFSGGRVKLSNGTVLEVIPPQYSNNTNTINVGKNLTGNFNIITL